MNLNKGAKNGIEILIVEDSPTQAERTQHLLAGEGYKVTLAVNGKEALAALHERKTTLVLSDVLMPEMDGFTLCKEIKAQEGLKNIPVILMTSLASPDDIMRGLECGADNFIRKPFDEKDLLTRIEFILVNQKLRRSERAQFGVEIYFIGKKYFITSERQQILDLLISTYEDAVRMNQNLQTREMELARSFQWLKGLYRVAEGLSGAKTCQEVVETVLQRAIELPDIHAGWISLHDGKGGFRLAGARGLPPALDVPGAFEGDCLCRRKFKAGELESVTNILECERLQKANGDTQGLRYHASIPLWIGNRTVGVMNLAGMNQGLVREEDLEILYGVGNQLALALERARLLEDLEQKVEERTAALRDEISVRKQAEEALRESEERYRFLFESNPLAMWIYDTDTLSFLAVNDSAIAHYGYSRDEFLAMTIKEIRPSEDVPSLLLDLRATSAVFSDTHLYRHRKKDGNVINVEITSHALPFNRGKTRLVLVNDVTERMRLEEQLRQAQKMESVGRLAGGIAHDFNNQLTIINGYSQLIMDQMEPGNPLRAQLEEIGKAGDRAASLTRQLLAFSRRQVLAPQVLDLNQVVANVEKMLRRLIGEDIDLAAFRRSSLGRVKADPNQIEQVIMNLAVNARDAMPKGGKLTIETANVELDEAYARTHAEVTPGSYVMLAVSDTGIGMDAETQAHIFEPFFTTKDQGKGTGLGLATVYGIVKQSGGNIWVYSEPGRGTTFKIYLPRAEEAATPAASHKVGERAAGGAEIILLVEDEEAVRTLVARILRQNGYQVLESTRVEEALQLGEQRKEPIDLLLTDVVMPVMSGRDVAGHLLLLRPEMKVLYMSGYTDNAIVHHGVLEPGTAFLPKPFTSEALLRKVREVLDLPHDAGMRSAA